MAPPGDAEPAHAVPQPATPVPPAASASVRQRRRLVRPHGFIDETGRQRHWEAGGAIADPREAAPLRDRGAPLERLG